MDFKKILNKLQLLLIALFVLFIATGCATTQPSVVVKTQTVYASIDANMLLPVPDKNVYLSQESFDSLDLSERFAYLGNLITGLKSSLKSANTQILQIKLLNDKNKAAVEKEKSP
jgi:hypothetical protein